jgi:CheY-like chemotaxis protein
MVTPSTRHDLQTPGAAAFTGYLVKPLRAASIAARLTAPPDGSTAQRTSDRQSDCETTEGSGASATAPAQSLSILVAEDNEINALLVRSLLARLGHDVTVAADGEEAVRHVRRRTAILALTANALTDDRHACLEAGMDGFLVKPLDRDKLVDALARLLATRHLAA